MCKIRFILMAIAIIGITIASSNPACATWKTIHGHTGHLEYPSNVINDDIYKGWGMDFTQYPNKINWVHWGFMTLYTSPSSKVNSLAFRFATGSSDAQITAIHVYNGDTKVVSLSVNWTGDWQTKSVSLGDTYTFNNGLGICVKVSAGNSASLSHRFIFGTIYAYYSEGLTSENLDQMYEDEMDDPTIELETNTDSELNNEVTESESTTYSEDEVIMNEQE